MSSTFPEEKLDPRVKRTRELIQRSFMEIVDEKGFGSISMQDVTARAGINRATFYAHFPDKYALLDYAIGESFRKEIEQRTLNVCEFQMENLRTLIVTVCEFVGKIHSHTDRQEQFQHGSKDHTKELVEAWRKKVGFPVVYHWQTNQGKHAAHNTALGFLNSELTVILDSEDMLFPDSVEQIVHVWQDGMSKLHFSLQGLDANGIPMNFFIPHQGQSLLSGDLSALLLRQGVYRTTPTTGNAFARGFLESVFPIPEGEWRLCPDADLHA